MNRYKPHKQKLLGDFNYFEKYKAVPKPKSLRTAILC